MRKRKNDDFHDEFEQFKRFKNYELFLRAQRNSHRERDRTPALSPPPTPGPPAPRSRASSSSSSGSSSRSSSTSSEGPRSGRSSRASRERDRSPSNEREPELTGQDSVAGAVGSPIREPSHNEDVPLQQEPRPSTSAAGYPPPLAADHAPPPPPLELTMLPAGEPNVVATTRLDDELLKILGDDPSKTKITGKDIQLDLAVRLQYIATSGLPKETRKELLDKYLPPGNCTLIDAPELNPEVKAAVSETVYKRDKGIKIKQKQLTSATSCVAEALTILLSSESKDMTLIRLLMDATKLLFDSQNQDSTTRRNFVLYNLKKELKDQLQETKIDKFIFSQDRADTLKAAKAISKSGADMKVTPTPQQAPKKVNKPTQNNLNWRAPPQNHRPKGTSRTKELARKTQHGNSSKQSFRRPPASTPSRSRN